LYRFRHESACLSNGLAPLHHFGGFPDALGFGKRDDEHVVGGRDDDKVLYSDRDDFGSI
jgi:hypothetical protein